MLTYNNRYIPYRNIICFLGESAGIYLAVLLSYAILNWNAGMTGISSGDIMIRGLVIALFTQFCMFVLDLYDFNVSFSLTEIFFSVIFTTGFLFIALGVLTYFLPEFRLADNMYYLTGFLILIFLFLWRYVLEVYIVKYSFSTNVAVVGSGLIAAEIGNIIRKSKRLGFNLAGYVCLENGKEGSHPTIPRSEPLWSIADLDLAIRQDRVNHIIVASEDRRGGIPIQELLRFKVNGVKISEWPEFYEKLDGKIPVKNLSPSYFVFNDGFRTPRMTRFLMQLSSFIVSMILLVFLAVPFLIVAILIRSDSKGPIFYTQKRVRDVGKHFNLIKFRTMIDNAEKGTGVVWAQRDDPRVTRVGKYLRKFRIDELPQLFNVLKGEMNIVGPRPERPEFVETLEKEIPFYSLRHSIKPGVTGWAQVKFSYCGTIDESRGKLEYDLFYIKNRSLKLDLYILFKTVKILLLGRGSR